MLAKRRNPDARVVLLEAKSIGWAASGRNGGFCEASLTHGRENGMSRWPEELTTLERLGLENLDAIEAAEAEFGMDFEFERNGALTLAVEPHQVEWLREEAAEAAARGDESVRFLDEAAVRAEVDSPTYLGGRVGHPRQRASCTRRSSRSSSPGSPRSSASRSSSTPPCAASTPRGRRARSRSSPTAAASTPQRAVLATNVFPILLKRNRLMTVPVYDYALMTEPLTAEQLASIGWSNRQGLGDLANQFHYYRLSRDNRVLFGGYDAVYHYGRRVRERYEHRPASFELLANHFFTTFPQLEGLRFTHQWAGAIDTSHPVLRVLRNRTRRPRRVRGRLHRARRRGDPVRRRGHARPARAARHRAHPAADGARAAAAVPARARRPPSASTRRAGRSTAPITTEGKRNMLLKTLDALGLGFDS